MKVLIPQTVHPAGVQLLKDNGFEIVLGSGFDEDTIVKEIADVDAVLCRLAPYTRRIVEAGKNLKLLARHGVGYENIDLKACEDNGIIVTNNIGANSLSVAEHAMSMILACAKHMCYFDKETRKGNWATMRGSENNILISSLTLGVIGIGNVGKNVARIAHDGFGMKILTYDKFANPASLPDYVNFVDELDDLIKNSDVITIHCPSLPETQNMFCKRTFDLMKKDSILVNCARGGIVNEDDLYDALKANKIFAAGADVLLGEPIKEHKLYSLDNFIISPHVGGQTEESEKNLALGGAQAIVDVLNKRWPKSMILYPDNARWKISKP